MSKAFVHGLACGVTICVAQIAQAAESPTFERDVLPIMQKNCQTCHRPRGANMSGMIAPMSLMTYQEVRPWAKAISRVVKNGVMPPWHATKEFHGVFKNERTLTDEERATLLAWVESGATRGDPKDAPAPIQFDNSGWQLAGTLGAPNMLLKLPDPYWVPDEVVDVQPNIQIKLTKEQLPEMRWIRAIEYRPGSEVVHHIVGSVLRPGDKNDPRNRSNFGQIASGTNPQSYPEGYGLPLYPESTVNLSMHYHKEAGPGTGVWDQSEIAVWFHDKPVVHPLQTTAISHGDFEVPPRQKSWTVSGAMTWTDEFLLLEMVPHMHLRGSSARYTAVLPDGTKEVLLDVPHYDYSWQTQYEYGTYKKLPAGTRIEWEITYDNSPEKAAEAGFNSDLAVRFGGPTTDEMDLGFLTWCYTEENKAPEARRDPFAQESKTKQSSD